MGVLEPDANMFVLFKRDALPGVYCGRARRCVKNMANKKTKEFEIFVDMSADTSPTSETIDLNQFVQVADMEAFGLTSVEVGIQPDEVVGDLFSNKTVVQVALCDLQSGFVHHSNYDSLFLSYQDGSTGFVNESLSLGDSSGVRYVPGGLIDVRAYAATATNMWIRLSGHIATLSSKDYLALVMTERGQ